MPQPSAYLLTLDTMLHIQENQLERSTPGFHPLSPLCATPWPIPQKWPAAPCSPCCWLPALQLTVCGNILLDIGLGQQWDLDRKPQACTGTHLDFGLSLSLFPPSRVCSLHHSSPYMESIRYPKGFLNLCLWQNSGDPWLDLSSRRAA